MKSLEVLIFDLSGEYGHFRKFNTTSSPLTYTIPTRMALIGMLGAVLGIEREISNGIFPKGVTPVNEVFARGKSYFAIQVLNPVKKVNIGFNLLDTGKSASSFFNIQNRTQIEFELLKNPKFRIFFSHSDNSLFTEIQERIKQRKHHFTPYLGLSQFTANLEWIGVENLTLEKGADKLVEIISVVNLTMALGENHVVFRKNAFYSSDTMPITMRRDRVITEYSEVLIERMGQSIQTQTASYWKSSYGNILFI